MLKELHDELDRAVFAAYGWDDLAETLIGKPGATTPLPDKPAEQAEAEEALLMRLVALNQQRAAEEAKGHVRWLRPAYQARDAMQAGAALSAEAEIAAEPAAAKTKPTWPKVMLDQIEAPRALLIIGPQTTDGLASQFKRKPTKGVSQMLAALEGLGHVQSEGEQWRLVR